MTVRTRIGPLSGSGGPCPSVGYVADPNEYPSSNPRRRVRVEPEDPASRDSALENLRRHFGTIEEDTSDEDDLADDAAESGEQTTPSDPPGGKRDAEPPVHPGPATRPTLRRTVHDRWWIDGFEKCLLPLHSSALLTADFCEEFGLEVPHHIVQLSAMAIYRCGPGQFDPPLEPPTTHDQWRAVVAQGVVVMMDERHHRYRSARQALRKLKRPKTTLRTLAKVVQRAMADQIVLDDSTAYDLVTRAHRLVLDGPKIDGGWWAPIEIDEPIEMALWLAGRHACALAHASPRFDSPGVPLELIAQMIPTCQPSAPESVASLFFDRIGPLAVSDTGQMMSARPRGGPVVLLGKSGMGKTQNLLTILQTLVGAAVITTTKPFDLVDWIAVRGRRVHLLNATEERTGLEGICNPISYDPLSTVRTVGDARRLADLIISTELGANRQVSEGEFWSKSAADLMWPLVLFAAHNGKDLTDAYQLMLTEEFDKVRLWCRSTGNALAESSIDSYLELDGRTRTSIQATAKVGMRPYADDLVHCMNQSTAIDWKQVIRDGETIVLYSNDRTAGYTRSYYVAVLDSLVTAAAELVAEGWTGPKLHMLLDECANVVPHPDLPAICSVAPGMGVNFVLSFQDVAQMTRVWGDAGGRELFNNAGAVAIHPGSTDIWLRHLLASLEAPTVVEHDGTPNGAAVGVPTLPPGPGEVIVIDEHGRPNRGHQVLAHREPMFIGNRMERSLLADPEFRELVAGQLVASRRTEHSPTGTDATRHPDQIPSRSR